VDTQDCLGRRLQIRASSAVVGESPPRFCGKCFCGTNNINRVNNLSPMSRTRRRGVFKRLRNIGEYHNRSPLAPNNDARGVFYSYLITTFPFAQSSSMIISKTEGTEIVPQSGFLILMMGEVILASTSLFSKAKSAPCISQFISLRPLQ